MSDDAERFARAERLRNEGRLAEAEALYRRILKRRPHLLAVHRALARALSSQGRGDDAAAVMNDARALEAEHLCKVARAALRHHRLRAATTCFDRALKLEPGSAAAVSGLANAWSRRGAKKKALAWYRRLLEIEPGSRLAEHMIATLGGGPEPARASDGYVETLFDYLAGDYDRHLVETLEYRAPEILLEAVSRVLPRPPGKLDILDLGCGTGLAGVRFRPLARRLEGVDLSPNMVGKARARGIYDAVWTAELTAAMAAMEEAFDLLIAADVFVYFGDLRPVFAAAARTLRPGGLLGFTVEWRRAPRYKLTATGRYAHSAAYVRACAKSAGFREVSGAGAGLRRELRKSVLGYVSVMRRV